MRASDRLVFEAVIGNGMIHWPAEKASRKSLGNSDFAGRDKGQIMVQISDEACIVLVGQTRRRPFWSVRSSAASLPSPIPGPRFSASTPFPLPASARLRMAKRTRASQTRAGGETPKKPCASVLNVDTQPVLKTNQQKCPLNCGASNKQLQ